MMRRDCGGPGRLESNVGRSPSYQILGLSGDPASRWNGIAIDDTFGAEVLDQGTTNAQVRPSPLIRQMPNVTLVVLVGRESRPEQLGTVRLGAHEKSAVAGSGLGCIVTT